MDKTKIKKYFKQKEYGKKVKRVKIFDPLDKLEKFNIKCIIRAFRKEYIHGFNSFWKYTFELMNDPEINTI